MPQKRKKPEYSVLFSTTGNIEEAVKIAEHLVIHHLVACVNIIPSIRSIYWWNDSVNHDSEVLMIMKTEKSRIPEIERSIRSLHSYQTPELIAVAVDYGIQDYLSWIHESLTRKTATK